MAFTWTITTCTPGELSCGTIDSASLGVTTSVSKQVANLVTKTGRYYVARSIPGTGIYLNRADFVRGVYTLAAGDGILVATGDRPRLAEYPDGRVSLVYDGVNRISSADLGATWTIESFMFTATHPEEAVNQRSGASIVLGYSGPVDGPGQLLGMRKRPGDRWFNDNHLGSSIGTSQDAAFTCVDNTGTPLAVTDDAFGLDADPSGRFVLTLQPVGGGALLHYWSGDEGKTWSPWST